MRGYISARALLFATVVFHNSLGDCQKARTTSSPLSSDLSVDNAQVYIRSCIAICVIFHSSLGDYWKARTTFIPLSSDLSVQNGLR